MSAKTKARGGRWLLVLVASFGLAWVLWPWPGDERTESAEAARDHGGENGTGAPRAAETWAAGARPAAPALSTGVEALHEALREEAVPVAAGTAIDGIDTDRPWVCAGEPIGLSARLAAREATHEAAREDGAPAPDAVYRWIWPAAGGGAALHPGLAMDWQAPEAPGTYQVHFQACKDLGGRRVGVLAERVVDIDVRACGAGEGQAHEPLRIRAVQRRHGAFSFHAEYRGDASVETYAWDFGDGTTETTTATAVEHAYPVQALGPQQVGRHAVRLEARLAGGARLRATTFALVRGRPPTYEPPAMDLDIARWRPRADGNGWQSELTVRNPADTEITWDRLERVTKRFDGSADIDTLAWRDVITVDELLAGGGFRGSVLVDAAEVPPEVKQILDYLYGHDADGNEVMVAWTPFKRPAPPSSDAQPRPSDEPPARPSM